MCTHPGGSSSNKSLALINQCLQWQAQKDRGYCAISEVNTGSSSVSLHKFLWLLWPDGNKEKLWISHLWEVGRHSRHQQTHQDIFSPPNSFPELSGPQKFEASLPLHLCDFAESYWCLWSSLAILTILQAWSSPLIQGDWEHWNVLQHDYKNFARGFFLSLFFWFYFFSLKSMLLLHRKALLNL